MVITILSISGAAYFLRSVHETNMSEMERHSTEALYIAEGALHQIIYDFREDFGNSGDWFDGDINGVSFTPTSSWQTFGTYSSAAMGDGNFTVEVQSVSGNPRAVRIRVTGVASDVVRGIMVNAEVVNLTPWDNAIFAGEGQAGEVINGNVDIRGPVHILGTGLVSTDLAADFSGSGNIGNNYDGISGAMSAKIPPAPIVSFGGEDVASLSAKVRIKHGKLGLSGTALAGSPNVFGNSLKETLTGMYITDGYGGNQGTTNVFSDNGTANGYDLGSAVSFQTFADPFKDDDGVVHATYTDFVQAKALDLSFYGITEISPDVPDFGPFTDGNGNSIQWTTGPGPNEGTLNIAGVVYAPSSLDISKKNNLVTYDGVGTIVALGGTSDIKVHGDLLSSGIFTQGDALALIAERNIEVATGPGESQIKMTAVFYGEDQIRSAKQNEIAGTFVSNYFDMGSNVPSIYQVPTFDAENHPGLIGRDPIYFMKINSWQEI